jgi:predicted amidohydrolase
MIRKFVFFLISVLPVMADVQFSSFCECDGWTQWSPRKEITPSFSIVAEEGRTKDNALKIETKSAADFGAWKLPIIQELKPGHSYRVTAWYKTRNVPFERHSIAPRVEWFDDDGKSLRPPEYGIAVAREGEWHKVEFSTPAPTKAASAELQLGFGFAGNATIWWDDISFEEEKNPHDRVINAVTIFHRPRDTKSAAESIEQFCQLAQSAASQKPDVLCLPEGVSVVGTAKTYWDVSEPIPGPATERLGTLARQLHSYVVAGVYERKGTVLYNTAVLLGRDGKLVGKYRKTHLPREEWEAGITPGNDYPVFDTDFGKVGLIICWDVQFPEPSRAMALKGAEVLLLPIWGGNETLAKARAIENHVFLVSSSYDMKTFIVDPAGKILAEATPEQPIASAPLHLDQKIFEPWLGDMKNRTWRERRPDIRID